MAILKLSIITQEKIVLEEEVQEVVVPTAAGILGILPEHTPLLTRIIPGELLVRKKGELEPLAISDGFMEVDGENLTILADSAVYAKDIDVKKVEEARERAEKLMHEKLDAVEYADLQKAFARAVAELKVAKKYKPR